MAITVSGTSITFNDATTQTTAFTGGSGTVTSVATGNGLSGGTITTSGTLTIAAPTFNSVGSWCYGFMKSTGSNRSWSAGSDYAAGASNLNAQGATWEINGCGAAQFTAKNVLSGTWRVYNTGSGMGVGDYTVLLCRVS